MAPIDQQLLALHNQVRTRPLAIHPGLTGVAAAWASRLAALGWLSHAGLDRRIAAAGLSLHAWAENAARGPTTADGVVRLWLASPGHRQNIVSPLYTRVGFGYAADRRGTIFWVADFGG